MLMKNPNDVFLFEDKNSNEAQRINNKIKRKNTDIPDKPNNVKKIYKGKLIKKKATDMRWTDVELAHSRQKNRVFQYIEELKPTKADLEPMYSSFNPKRIFKAPPSSKECLIRQKKKESEEPKINQGTKNTEIIDVDSTAFQILDTAKTNLFKRVKTAYGTRRNTGNMLAGNDNWFEPGNAAQKETINFNTHRVGFRTGAFNMK